MKKYEKIDSFKSEIHHLLSSLDDVKLAFEKIKPIYSDLILEIPLLKPFDIKLVKTKSLQYQVYYQSSPKMSKNSIVIVNNNYDAYLWVDCDGWCLDDSFNNVDEIASKLCKVPAFENIPESVRELKSLIVEGHWLYREGGFPVFGGEPPSDMREVLSWDSSDVLVGTNKENIEVMPRLEWQKLCERENSWFKNGNA